MPSKQFLLAALMVGQVSATETALTIEDVRQRAATFNRQYLSAQQDLEQLKGRLRFLDEHTSYSTITMSIFEKGTEPVEPSPRSR